MKKTTSLAHATVNGAEQDPPLGFPYCDDDTAVSVVQVSLGGGLKGYTVVRTSCESNEYCGDGHCCPNGEYWDSSRNICIEAQQCSYEWGVGSQIMYGDLYYTYYLNVSVWDPSSAACCYYNQYNLWSNWWSQISTY